MTLIWCKVCVCLIDTRWNSDYSRCTYTHLWPNIWLKKTFDGSKWSNHNFCWGSNQFSLGNPFFTHRRMNNNLGALNPCDWLFHVDFAANSRNMYRIFMDCQWSKLWRASILLIHTFLGWSFEEVFSSGDWGKKLRISPGFMGIGYTMGIWRG